MAKKEFPEYVYSPSGSLVMRCPGCKDLSLGDAVDVFVNRNRGTCLQCGHEREPVMVATP